MLDKGPESPEASLWPSLGPVEQAREWEEFRPGTFEQMFGLVIREAEYRRALADQDAKHERRLDYIAIGLQLLSLASALAAVAILSLIAKYYVDHGAASQGVKVFGFGAGSIVATFLGVSASPMIRRVSSRSRRKSSD
jgi:hypothetical protein